MSFALLSFTGDILSKAGNRLSGSSACG